MVPGLVNVYKKLWKNPPFHHFQWVNPLCLWAFSIAFCKRLPGRVFSTKTNFISDPVSVFKGSKEIPSWEREAFGSVEVIENRACPRIWVNYNISLTWIVRPFGDDVPYKNHDSSGRTGFGRDEIYPEESRIAILTGDMIVIIKRTVKWILIPP